MTNRTKVQLQGLAGVKDGRLLAAKAHSISGCVRMLKANTAVIASGDNGSITIWCDDAKTFHMEFCRYRQPLSEAKAVALEPIKAWLRTWWPQMQR